MKADTVQRVSLRLIRAVCMFNVALPSGCTLGPRLWCHSG